MWDHLKESDVVFLDHAALEVLGSNLIAQDIRNIERFEVFRPTDEEHMTGVNSIAFVLFTSLSQHALERIAELNSWLQPQVLIVLTPVHPNGNLQYFSDSNVDYIQYPSDPLQYNSKQYGPVQIRIERLPFLTNSCFPNIVVLPKSHEFQPNDESGSDLAFDHLNGFLWSLNVVEEVYSIGLSADRVADRFVSFSPAAQRRKYIHSTNMKDGQCLSASVIFLPDLAMWDPVGCVEPYVKPAHLLDLIFSQLSRDGHSVDVHWDSIGHYSTSTDHPESIDPGPFSTDLLQTAKHASHRWLSAQLMLKEQDALAALQNDVLDIAALIHHSLPEMSKVPQTRGQWASHFHDHVQRLFGPVCQSGQWDLLNSIQLIMATSLALSASAKRSKKSRVDTSHQTSTIDHILSRFERSLLVASQFDAKSLAQLEEPTKCEPILLQVMEEVRKLPTLDERFLAVTHFINILPVQSPLSHGVWSAVETVLECDLSGKSMKRGILIPSYVTNKQLISNLKALREERRKLPSYNNLWTHQPRYRSPVVQWLTDMVRARSYPKEASPALRGLKHHAATSDSSTWLTGLSRYIRIPGSDQATAPYSTDYVVLVCLGSFPFALARDIFELINTSAKSSNCFKLKILINRFTGGPNGLSGFFPMPF